jgi:predicted MFS family arabinose efflux permease
LEAASIPAAGNALATEARPFAESVASRLALGIAAGLIAVLVHGEAPRLATEELTWRALLGR